MHTKGQWVSEDGEAVWSPIEKKIVCQMAEFGEPDTDEQMANARLIAAAPELLEALEDCLKWLEWETRPQCTAETLAELCDNTRAAIAKAKGDQTT